MSPIKLFNPEVVEIPALYDDMRDFQRLFALRQHVESITNPLIHFRFDSCTFLKQNAVVVLGALIEALRRNGKVVTIDWDSFRPSVLNNLRRNGFASSFGGPGQWEAGNSVIYRQDPLKDKNLILDYLLTDWLQRGGLALRPEMLEGFLTAFWELYENGFDHGREEGGVFSCGQYFPNLRELALAIVDLGPGICSTVQDHMRELFAVRPLPRLTMDMLLASKTPHDALRWAFEMGNSTKTKLGGMGLHCVKQLIQENGGRMVVFSNGACVEITKAGEQYKRHAPSFRGTLINLTVRC